MIERSEQLSVTRQARLLGISRGSVYYLPRPVSEADLTLMRRIDELHLEHPFMIARMLRDQLHREGIKVGRKFIGTLMQRMGISALAPQPGTTSAHRATRSIRTCCAMCRSPGPIRSGRWTQPVYRWRAVSSTSPQWSMCSAVAFWLIRSPSR